MKGPPVSKRQERQRFIRYYREKTGESEIDMHKVAEFAKEMGWKMPAPLSDVDMLAKLFADDAQSEQKYDDKTGNPYRVYHALPASGQMNLFVYVDIDEATRTQMLKSAVNRRDQMVNDGYKLTLDLDHWNGVNPDKDPIQLPMDLTLDIEIKKAASEEDDDDEAA
jgi:hypothetical protein